MRFFVLEHLIAIAREIQRGLSAFRARAPRAGAGGRVAGRSSPLRRANRAPAPAARVSLAQRPQLPQQGAHFRRRPVCASSSRRCARRSPSFGSRCQALTSDCEIMLMLESTCVTESCRSRASRARSRITAASRDSSKSSAFLMATARWSAITWMLDTSSSSNARAAFDVDDAEHLVPEHDRARKAPSSRRWAAVAGRSAGPSRCRCRSARAACERRRRRCPARCAADTRP